MANNFRYSVTGKVLATDRVGVSGNANPVYDVSIVDSEGTAHIHRTSADVGLVYGITNPGYRDNAHTFGLTRAGRLNGYTKDV